MANKIFIGDCVKILPKLKANSIDVCITDPPYNYEFIGKNWDNKEINRRISKVKNSKTLVKNIPYGSGLAGGVRNKRWYDKFYNNLIDYQNWVHLWGYLISYPAYIAFKRRFFEVKILHSKSAQLRGNCKNLHRKCTVYNCF